MPSVKPTGSEVAAMVAIGSRIKAAREAAGMILSDVEKKSGVYASSLSRIEHGERSGKPASIGISTLYRVCKAIGVHPSEVLAEVSKPPRNVGVARMCGIVRRNMAAFRTAAGLTRRELAVEMGSSQNVINQIEEANHADPVIPTLTMLLRVAEALEIDVVQLFLPIGGEYTNPV